jgi:beta-galactosidase
MLAVWRAPVDNDGLKLVDNPYSALHRWRSLGLDRTTAALDALTIRSRSVAGGIEVRTRHTVGAPGLDATIGHDRRMRFLPDGTVEITEEVLLPEELEDLPRIGVQFELATGFEDLEWYGRGPHECYPDRDRGAALGRYSSTVTEQYVGYVMPQEHGLHTAVRWLELRDGATALRIDGDRPLMFSALHHSAEDLTKATHDVELRARRETVVHLDVAHRGLGTASCGPDTLAKYRIAAGRHRWRWCLRPRRAQRRQPAPAGKMPS